MKRISIENVGDKTLLFNLTLLIAEFATEDSLIKQHPVFKESLRRLNQFEEEAPVEGSSTTDNGDKY